MEELRIRPMRRLNVTSELTIGLDGFLRDRSGVEADFAIPNRPAD